VGDLGLASAGGDSSSRRRRGWGSGEESRGGREDAERGSGAPAVGDPDRGLRDHALCAAAAT
jgi:hypothetical protein